ncbi:MAG: protein phosphatase 2C domain-containing protein, partial [Gemmatimonadetes bacterium]|nr:protein phosphatase 2C domain-containing protein [Gemmatimonadota bacterium]
MPLTPRHAAATHVGRVRQSNEDRFYADEGAGIFVVADGMGGHAAGEVAAEIASTLIGKRLSAAADTSEMAELATALEAAIAEADQRILDRARGDPACSGMGTTVTALCTRPDS